MNDVLKRSKLANNLFAKIDPSSPRAKGCCGGIANIETGGNIYLRGDTDINLKSNTLSFASTEVVGSLIFTLDGEFPPGSDPAFVERYSGLNDDRLDTDGTGDPFNSRTIALGDFSNLGMGEYAVLTGITGDDLTTSSSATAYNVFSADGRAYLEQESITRKAGNAEIFQGSITYSAGDASLISASVLKDTSTGNADWLGGAYAEVSGATGDINTALTARGYATNGSIALTLSAVDVGVSDVTMTFTPTGINIQGIPAYADDADAGANGLVAGDEYQTDGTGGAPLNVAGIRMVKQ